MKAGRLILGAIIAAGCIFSSVGCNSEKSSVGNVETINFVDGDKLAEITIEGYGVIKAKLFPDLCPNGVENFIMLAEQGYYDGLKIHRVVEDSFIQGGSLLGDGTGEKALINENGSFDLETSNSARHLYGALCYANNNGKNATQFYIVSNSTPQTLTKYDPEKILVKAASYTLAKEDMTEGSTEYENAVYMEGYYTRLAEMIKETETDAAALYAEKGGLPLLDGGSTVFGQVYEGFDVIKALSEVEVQYNAQGEKSKPLDDIVISSVKIIDYKAPTTAESTAEEDDKNSDKDNADKDDNDDKNNVTAEGTADGSDSAISTLEASEKPEKNETSEELQTREVHLTGGSLN